MDIHGESVVIKQPTGTSVLTSEELAAARCQMMQPTAPPAVFVVQPQQQQQQSRLPPASVNPVQPQQQVSSVATTSQQPQQGEQPTGAVEFNYAINYVNKIKLRFQVLAGFFFVCMSYCVVFQ